jgi:hypothetical protein
VIPYPVEEYKTSVEETLEGLGLHHSRRLLVCAVVHKDRAEVVPLIVREVLRSLF